MLKWIPIACLAFAFHAAHGAEEAFAFEDSMRNESPSALQPVLNLQLRQDTVRDLPRPVEADFERWEARLRFGTEWRPEETLLFRATGRVFDAEQENDQVTFNLDNERLNDIALDELYMDMQAGQSGSIVIGQTALPLVLSPMIWDTDLRLRGMRVLTAVDSVRHTHRLSLVRGRVDHVSGSEARLSALQWRWRFQYIAGATEVLLAGLRFDALDTLPEAFRTNSRANEGLATEFRVVDMQFAQSFGNGVDVLRIGVDIASNLEAKANGDAARLDIRYGDAVSSGGFEAGAAVQRIQADAVPAAFNDDNWWFPTRMRGHAAWAAFGFDNDWSVRFAVFREKRDGAQDYAQRALLDVSWRF